jgi:hypothetical protein
MNPWYIISVVFLMIAGAMLATGYAIQALIMIICAGLVAGSTWALDRL